MLVRSSHCHETTMTTSQRCNSCVCTPGLDPVTLGGLLGIANALVIAVGMHVMEAPQDVNVAGFVFVIGFLPAVFTGGLLGRVAHGLRSWRVWPRRIVLTVPAVLVVVLLAETFHCREYIGLAFMPTIAAALWLERNTRESRVPAARAL